MTAKIRAISDPRIDANSGYNCGVYFSTSTNPQQTKIFIDMDNSKTFNSGDIVYQFPFQIAKECTLIVPKSPVNYPDQIIFRSDGSAAENGKAIIKIKGGRADTLNVLASTGRIRFKKGRW
jgi:hypothetical protein